MTYRVQLSVPKIPLFTPGEATTLLRREVGTAVASLLEDIASEARLRTPVGVSGILRASIGTRLMRGTDASVLVHGEVFTGAQAPYALFVEEGTRPHFPPRAPIELWAQRVLGDRRLWFVVARAIARRGTRARHMFRDALDVVKPRIFPTVQAAAAVAWQRIGRG